MSNHHSNETASRRAFIENVVHNVQQGSHATLPGGIHIHSLVEDLDSVNNRGLNQARFSTSLAGLDLLLRFSDDTDEPEQILMANEDFDAESLRSFEDEQLATLLGRSARLKQGNNDAALSTIIGVSTSHYDLINNTKATISTLVIYNIEFANSVYVNTHHLVKVEGLQILTDTFGFMDIIDFLDR